MKEHIIPICLPTSPELRNMSKTMNQFLIAGWGLTENNTYSVLPLEINAFRTNCSLYAPSNSICVSGDRNDTCNGDSGNALIYAANYYKSQRLVQFGIVSRGSQECNSGVPSINTNLIDYLPWINEKLVM
ncbi:serine protease grass-like [Drosophila willistoni]|uniref:serine protease grass-like n=1 Tax=Drosophila willistoni TaxID=7260 RepID=UPI001F077411|nr:serine protease grass-like [Drosophila willistoni]